ncbi:sulfohydrolase/Glycosulfatase, Zn-dependent hydrolase [Tritrichomonas foetus]|uniref:Sulfohydrolase/Glycosulfatase, Zn-dependent hydrolase n=1 Tax=Tritrichomonas foetus TaxID=1144522 RepID=A0A1J4KQQ4_9EUKA|nr:sulfohydrolase/Glycosulfatase, Zn-dependent hydrolase [Tritrichomonas foetus]|eukprot:OHT11998.1 sulfohydrolase/Glycosulfatase, Zn-dependent hydrolase [Tritrichomonas foetus]
MVLEVHCLGTNGFHSTESSHTACYMIPSLGVIFDAGSGFFRVVDLIRKWDLEEVNIFMSHGHMDHIDGIHSTLEIIEMTKCKKVNVFAEQKVLNGIKTIFADPFFPSLPPMNLIPLDLETFHEISLTCPNPNIENNCGNPTIEVKVNYFPLKHTTTCFGYVLEALGKRIAYVTDTSSNPCSTYIKNLENLDTLFHEVHSINEEQSVKFGHTDAENLAKVCNIVKPKKLVTIHHNPNGDRYEIVDFIKKEFCDVVAAEDKMIISI